LIVVDASVLVIALADDQKNGATIRSELLLDIDLYAPELIDLEVISVLRKLVLLKELAYERASQAIQYLQLIRLNRVSHQNLLGRCWELYGNVTPYDASYIALAETLNCVLITADKKLANSPGTKCKIKLIEQ
jgi:predicted nucleic acid-binding protein